MFARGQCWFRGDLDGPFDDRSSIASTRSTTYPTRFFALARETLLLISHQLVREDLRAFAHQRCVNNIVLIPVGDKEE
eukprot:9234061-Pyramimonas_sp.AAC.1